MIQTPKKNKKPPYVFNSVPYKGFNTVFLLGVFFAFVCNVAFISFAPVSTWNGAQMISAVIMGVAEVAALILPVAMRFERAPTHDVFGDPIVYS